MPKCPNCGNTDAATIESNGEPIGSPDRTLLCLARVPENVSSYDLAEVGPDGLTECGWQWEPHSGRER